MTTSPHKDLKHIICAYLLGGLGVFGSIKLWVAFYPNLHPILIIFIADLIGTIIIFTFSQFYRNASFYDPYWSLAPPLIGLYFLSISPIISLQAIIILILISLWSVRLTLNWAKRWQGLKDEDWRYRDIRSASGIWFPLSNFFAIQLMPTLLVFLATMPFYFIATTPRQLGWLDILTFTIIGASILIQAIADNQLRDFLKTKSEGQILKTGLWRNSRHPNYFGEICFWWGIGLAGFLTNAIEFYVIFSGALAINILFITASVPLMNARGKTYRKNYDEHIAKTRSLIPLPKLGWGKK